MKITVKGYPSEEVLAELNIDDPNKITIFEFAQLFFQKINKKNKYYIEPTQYTIRDHVTAEDFYFISQGKQFSSKYYSVCEAHTKKSQDTIASFVPKQAECIVHAILSVYGKRNYCLNSHIQIFSRKQLSNNQLTDAEKVTLKSPGLNNK